MDCRSIEELWQEGGATEPRQSALIVEPRGSYLGREVILDLSAYKLLVVRRVSAEYVALKWPRLSGGSGGGTSFQALFLVRVERGELEKILGYVALVTCQHRRN